MPVQLHEPGWQVALMTAAYYHVLNDDDAFGRALASLYQALGEIGDRTPTPAERELMRRFSDQWPLPQTCAVDDLWFSAFETWEPPLLTAPSQRRLPEVPMITLDFEFVQARPIWIGTERARLSVDLQARGLTLEGGGWTSIFAPKPEPDQYFYDPSFMRRRDVDRWADEVASRIRQSILDQADEVDRRARAAGMRPLPPWLHNRDHLLLMARCLYRRAVRKESWGIIARHEPRRRGLRASTVDAEIDSRDRDRQAVKRGVDRWAMQLRVPLPPDPRKPV